MMTTTILFDYYGVFQTDSYQNWLNSNGLTRTGPYLELIQKVDKGELDHDKFLFLLSQQIGRKVGHRELDSEQQLDLQVIKLVKSLKSQYRIGLLSNASGSLRGKLDTLRIASLFDAVIVSSEHGVAKPSQNIYAIALAKLSSTPAETIYIDDNSQYVLAAKKAGMMAIHFKTAADLHRRLVKLGVVVD